MLVTMLSAMYVMVRVVESIGMRFARRQEPFPYMASQPLPWQVHSVSHRRRSSKADEFDGLRRNSIGVFRKNSNVVNGTHSAPALASAPAPAPPPGPAGPPLSPASPLLSPVEVERAAATIQSHFRKFQQKRQKNGK